MEADFPENYHDVDRAALEEARAVNQVGTAEWIQGQQDKAKLSAWGSKQLSLRTYLVNR